MNFFICNRYETKNEDIYLIGRKNHINKKKSNYHKQEILNPEKTFVLIKDNKKESASENIDKSDELQIIEYPYNDQHIQNNLKKGVYNRTKIGGSFINNFQYYAKINNMNNNEENNKKDFNKNSTNACLSTNFERNIDDKLLSENIEYDIDDTIKGEDNININKLKLTNNNISSSHNYPVKNNKKHLFNNLSCNNFDNEKNNKNMSKNYKRDKSKSSNNSNKKIKSNIKKKFEDKKILQPSKSFLKVSEKNNINKYKQLNKNLTNNFNPSIKNKSENNVNKKKECNNLFNKSLKCKKFRNTNNYNNNILNDRKLNGKNILTCETNTNENSNIIVNNNTDFDIANIIKEKFKKNIVNSNFLKNGKSTDKDKSNYSTKEVIKKFRYYKRINNK